MSLLGLENLERDHPPHENAGGSPLRCRLIEQMTAKFIQNLAEPRIAAAREGIAKRPKKQKEECQRRHKAYQRTSFGHVTNSKQDPTDGRYVVVYKVVDLIDHAIDYADYKI